MMEALVCHPLGEDSPIQLCLKIISLTIAQIQLKFACNFRDDLQRRA
jgi:hypothetical protein